MRKSNLRYKANHRQKLCEKQKAYRLANIEKVSRKEQEKTRIYRARKANVVSDEHTIPELHQYWRAKGIDPKAKIIVRLLKFINITKASKHKIKE